MQRTGPKTKPLKLKILEGDIHKERFNLNEPKINSSIPEMPAHLNTYAKKEWQRIAPILERIGILTEIDMAALAGYCQSYGRWVQVEQNIKKLGKKGGDGMIVKSPKGYLMVNPYLSIANKEREFMHKFLIEFGMTPSSRSRIVVSKQDNEEDDGLQEFRNILNHNN
jgi:P27 family predicted phage terminase small subunit